MRRGEYKILRNCVVGREWERWRWRGNFVVERIGLGWGFRMCIYTCIAGRCVVYYLWKYLVSLIC